MRNKNSSRSVVPGKGARPMVAAGSRLVQVLNEGKHLRVFRPDTGTAVHGEYDSEAVRAALVAVVSEGYGPRLLEQAGEIKSRRPLVADLLVSVASAN